MNKQANRYVLFFLICFLGLSTPKAFAQTIEQAYGLRFSKQPYFFNNDLSYRFTIDSTQVANDGFYSLRIRYNNVLTLKSTWGDKVFTGKHSKTCRLSWSRTVVLPEHVEKKEYCTVTLNYKSELEGFRLFVTAKDKKENTLYADSAILSSSDQWTSRSFTFCNPEARAVNIFICNDKGCNDANEGLSIYLNKISIRLGNQELNNLPMDSLISRNDTSLKPEAIIPLSLQDDASLNKIRDWKDKKIIALGESMDGIQDLREAQIQFMKHLITSENCKLIFLQLPQSMCIRWNLYLQGKRTDVYEDKLKEEVEKLMYSSAVFFEFLKWIRQYNVKAIDPVRIIGTTNDTGPFITFFMADYLLNFSTNRQDSLYYLKTLTANLNKYADLKKYISQSQLSKTLNKKDLQYLLSLIEDIENISKRPWSTTRFGVVDESVLDKAKRIERVIDIYLSPAEKAVIIAPSGQITKHFPISDLETRFSSIKTDSLGSYLYQRYGKQYYAMSFQIGERTGLMDLEFSANARNSVIWKYLFPFAFEKAAMDTGIPYFYFSSNQLPDGIYYPFTQLPDGILGLNMYTRFFLDPFCYCDVASHFDALVFIREARAPYDDVNINSYSFWGWDYCRQKIIDIDKLLKELSE